jgi:formylglycine-generating enzyme required for sulfatase activity/serine/threonine protein kinase
LKGRYHLIAELGSGGMGITYRAWDADEGKPVVVKMLQEDKQHDPILRARFLREIEAMRSMPHPSIVPIIDAGIDQGEPFAVMKYLTGGSLADYRRWGEAGNGPRNPPGMLFCWLREVAAALDHIHGRGMIHRDIKPGNIFLDGFLRPFLGDFGIAKFIDESAGSSTEQALTAATAAIGTLEYMAPEMFRSKPLIHGRGDQYALAVTVYEMLSGDKPFDGSTANLIVEHVSAPVPPLDKRCPNLPRSAHEAVHRALSKDPDQRFPSCSEFAAAVLRDIAPMVPEPGVVRLLCLRCKNILKLKLESAGRAGRCPKCQSPIDVAPDLGSLSLKSERPMSRTETPAGDPATEAATKKGPGEDSDDRGDRVLAGYGWIIAAGVLVLAHVAGNMAQVPIALQSGIAVAAIVSYAAMRRAGARALPPSSNDRRATVKKPRADPRSASPAPDGNAESPGRDHLLPQKTRSNSIDMRFVMCQGGDFLMGDAEGAADETPHRITLSQPFFIGEFPVTYGQWCRVMEERPDPQRDTNTPMIRVTWTDAMEFCRRLTQFPQELHAGRTYRLPSEAEWEYACRAGSTTTYPWGNERKQIADHCWYVANAGGRPQQVGQKMANQWGVSDMLGNVWEWCSDWYAEDFYLCSPPVDPVGPDAGSRRVIRGGSWGDSAGYCRPACRGKEPPENPGSGIGLRVVCSSKGPWR